MVCARRLARAIPHVRQQRSWDCGLACCDMVLRALGHKSSLRQLTQRAQSESLWTIDLAHILHGNGVKFKFFTTLLGANPAYHSEDFYRATLDDDSQRVSELFERAVRNDSMHVELRSFAPAEFRELIRPNDSIVMALVDQRRLYPPMSAFLSPPASSFLARFVAGSSNEYAGHYVLIAGMDAARDAYVVMDPARDDAEVSVPRADVDAARRSWGTDEDLIVVPRGQ